MVDDEPDGNRSVSLFEYREFLQLPGFKHAKVFHIETGDKCSARDSHFHGQQDKIRGHRNFRLSVHIGLRPLHHERGREAEYGEEKQKGGKEQISFAQTMLSGASSEKHERLSRDAGRDLEITSATRGATFAYEASLRKSFRPIARLMDNPPSSAINGMELAVCGSSSVCEATATGAGVGVTAAAAGGVVWMTVVTSTSFCSGVTATIGTVLITVSSMVSTATAGTNPFVAWAS